jgi:hypothetical protein
MESDSYPDLSPEQLYAHKVAAKELVKYCEEFARWRTAKWGRARSVQSPRMRENLVPRLNEKPGPPEPYSAA